MTELNSENGAHLLFSTANTAAINITGLNVTNTTSLHGKGAFAGLVTTLQGSSMNVTNSTFEYSIAQEDPNGADVSVAPLVKNINDNGSYRTQGSAYRIRGVYMENGCNDNCSGLPKV